MGARRGQSGRAAAKLLYIFAPRAQPSDEPQLVSVGGTSPACVREKVSEAKRGMRGMPTHLDHRKAFLPSGLPLAVVGHLLPKVFPALRDQRLDDLLPLLRPCASARRFRGLDTRGFARRRGAGTSAVRLLNPVGGVRLQLLQLHLCGLCILPRRLAHRRQDLQSPDA